MWLSEDGGVIYWYEDGKGKIGANVERGIGIAQAFENEG